MIAFTADNHLGITAQWAVKERGGDFLRAFYDLTDQLVADNSPDKALIIGGDLFDSIHPSSTAVAFAQSQIKRLTDAGYTVCGIDGNHDIADGKWLSVCGVTPLCKEPLTLSNGLKISGIHYARALDVISTINSMADEGIKCDILVLHLAFGELNRMGAASDICAAEILTALKTIGVKLVLMGHIHIRQSVCIDGITFMYSGSTEVCSMSEAKEKTFEKIDPTTLELSAVPIKTREFNNVVISTEEEFAKYEAEIQKDSLVFQSLFITPDIQEGVKRLRSLAKEKNLLMRIQILQQETVAEPESSIDRTSGVIGLEQAISLSFDPSSQEAELIRTILRSPASLNMIIEKFMQDSQEV